ncbi:MAG: hypothetical protein V2I33_16740 [Kangiellaceae bacterium]|jgi:hypothetical protein|nr:hypothetical protein [Kangiellaceae bacterium]
MFADLPINSKEAAVPLLAVMRWRDHLRGQKVIVYCDNQAASAILNRGVSRMFLRACMRIRFSLMQLLCCMFARNFFIFLFRFYGGLRSFCAVSLHRHALGAAGRQAASDPDSQRVKQLMRRDFCGRREAEPPVSCSLTCELNFFLTELMGTGFHAYGSVMLWEIGSRVDSREAQEKWRREPSAWVLGGACCASQVGCRLCAKGQFCAGAATCSVIRVDSGFAAESARRFSSVSACTWSCCRDWSVGLPCAWRMTEG